MGLQILKENDPHEAAKKRADAVFFALVANTGEMQRIRKEARGRLQGAQKASEADLLRIVGQIAYEEAFFIGQGATAGAAYIDAAVAKERENSRG